ncbi:MAG TPA: prolipoprotein diacylglyceryl transferase family protein [Tepidisphaeraceae bacterium]|nr:prolipoprotein diacylglyceryl transferase family protein [Tepidisphaeraceae bacterium]
MYQELFRIPFIDRPVYGYGLMLVLAFVFASMLMKYLARRHGLNGDHFVTASLLGLVVGVVGARLTHVLENWSAFTDHRLSVWENFKNMINVSSGGLTFFGGFLFATPVLILYAIWRKVPVLRGMDIVAPCLMVGLAWGRMGCYLNGCCHGEECSLPWAVQFPYGSNAFIEQYQRGEISLDPRLLDPNPRHVIETLPSIDGHRNSGLGEVLPRPLSKEQIRGNADLEALAAKYRAHPVHPTQLYSVFNAAFIAAVCVAFLALAPAAGRVFALMLLLKGISRFALEMVRTEPPVWGFMSFSMVVSIGLVAAGILMWVVCGMIAPRRSSGSAGTPQARLGTA